MKNVESSPTISDRQEAVEKLKAILLSGERQKIETLEEELKELKIKLHDREKLLETLDPVTIDQLSRKVEQNPEKMARALGPVIGPAIKQQIASAKDDIVDALYPVIGRIIRKSVAEAIKNLARTVNEKLDQALSFHILTRRLTAKIKGVSPDETVLTELLPFQVHELFYIHKDSGLLLAHASDSPEEKRSKDVISGMLTAIKNFSQQAFQENGQVQDVNVIEYDDFQIYLENGRYAYLAAVITGVPSERFYSEIKETEASLHKKYAPYLRQFNGDVQPFAEIKNNLEQIIVSFQPNVKSEKKAPVFLKIAIILILLAVIAWPVYKWTSTPRKAVAHKSVEYKFSDLQQLRLLLKKKFNGRLKTDPDKIQFVRDGDMLILQGVAATQGERLQIARVVASEAGFPVVINDLKVKQKPPSDAENKINQTVIYFIQGSYRLSPDEMKKLDRLLPYLKNLDHPILISGFSDNQGSAKANLDVSLKRAESVKQYLASHGISPNKIKTEGFGIKNPAVPNTSAANRALNRRVTIKILNSE